MKFTCNTKEFSSACQTVARGASTKSSVPALEGIKISAEDEAATLCGYNLEMGITTRINTEGPCKNGAIVLDAKMLCSIAKKLPNYTMEINTPEKGVATIKSGEASFEIVGMPAEEYPEIPQLDEKISFSIAQPALRSMIDQTAFAINSSMDAKPIFTGALIQLSSGLLTMVGTDGYRLAVRKEAIEYIGEDFDCVVPKTTLLEASKLLGDEADKIVRLSIGTRYAAFTIDSYTIFTRLLEGEYLDYKTVVPKSSTTIVRLDTEDFSKSIERTSVMVNDHLKSPLVCEFSNARKSVNLSCNTSLGAASDSFPVKDLTGNDVKIGFNDRYLLDAISHTGSDMVQLQLHGPLSPMVVLPMEGDSFLFVVLPVRLKEADAK